MKSSFVRSVVHPLILWRAGELQRLTFLRNFRRSQFWDGARIKQMQLDNLEQLLYHAYQHCTFYRERMDSVGTKLGSDSPEIILQRLPVTEKKDIQQSWTQMVASNYDKNSLQLNQTGGSTGQPVKFYYDRTRNESRVAAMFRHDEWAGHKIGNRSAYIWGAPQDLPSNSWKQRLRNKLLGGQLWLDTSNLTEKRMLEFNHELKRFRPQTIIAYSNAMLLFSQFLKSRNIGTYRPQAIVTSAEMLTAEGRGIIEQTFGCPVFNRYGSREFSVIASECECHSGLHVMAEGLYLEVDHPPNGLGGSGDILVTDLLNQGMPMLRYRIGDRGELMTGQCPCGRGLPRLASLCGRTTDFLVGDDDRLVSGVSLATFVIANRPTLGKVQIVQLERHKLIFRIVKGTTFDEVNDLGYLASAAKKFLGKEIQVDFEFVDELLPTPSGKTLFSICKVPHHLMI